MTTTTPTDPSSPDGYTTVAPWVVTDDTAAFLDFAADVFHGEELARVAVEGGGIGHAEIRIGDTVVPAFDRHPEWPSLPSLLRVFLPDAAEAMERAVERGARVVTPVSDSAFGQRGGRIRDPWGNIWWVITVVEDVPRRRCGAGWRSRATPSRCASRRRRSTAS